MTMRKVIVSMLTEDQEFQQMQATDARATGARLGIEVEVLFADNNAIQQIHQLYGFIHSPEERRPAAIVVEAVAEAGLGRVALNAARAGIGWVQLNGTVGELDDLRREHPDVVASFVLVDEVEIGRIQGRQAHALLPAGGTLLLIQGPPDVPTTLGRRHGLEEEVQGTSVEIGRSLHGDWTEASGEKTVAGWLRLKTSEASRPDLVVCQNDAMAVGARRAIRAHRPDWGDVPLTGCDGLPAGGQRLVEAGELAATVAKPTTTGPGIEMVVRALRGDPAPSSRVLKPASCPSEEDLRSRPGAVGATPP
jgi:ABC-type sugar transport system substrate-binding protein